MSLSAQASQPLPQLGDGEEMSLAAEKKLGARIARELYRDPDYIDDPVLSDYVQRIWQPLLTAAKVRGDITAEMAREFAWELLLGKDKSINAFALPGGYFGLHLGLVSVVASRDELASVLAHEISHVAQRHIARQQTRQAQLAPWLLAAIILGSVAASKSPDAAGAVISGSQAVGAQAQLNYSRDMEREADRIGYALAQAAGFDVQGFVGMFDKLQQASRLNDNGSFPYLRSHPLTTERLGDMQARVQQEASAATLMRSKSLGEHAEHLLMAARARLLSDGSVQATQTELVNAQAALRLFETGALNNLPAQLKAMAQLYAGSLAALRQRNSEAALRYATASSQLAQLLSAQDTQVFKEKQPAVSMKYAQIAIELVASEASLLPGNTALLAQRLERLQSLSATAPEAYSRAVLLARALAALASPHTVLAAPVIEALQNRVAERPGDAQAWQALGQLYAAQGLPLRSLRAQAESRMALLDYSGALDRLKAAQEQVRSLRLTQVVNHVDASIIDTRTRQVQALLRELQTEK